MEIYDVIIIGAGPAGLTASIYSSRYKLSNLVIGKQVGGEFALAHKVDNYPGYMGISGMELAEKWKKQAESLGAKVLLKSVEKIEVTSGSLGSLDKEIDLVGSTINLTRFSKRARKSKVMPYSYSRDANLRKHSQIYCSHQHTNSKNCLSPHALGFKVIINNNEIYESRALIVATGSERRRLNIPGEKEYLGRGVSYCFVCDAPFFKGKTVALIGGNDSAVSGAVHTADFAKKVFLIYRGEALRAEPIWQEEWKKIEASGKGVTIFNTNLKRILGNSEIKKLNNGNQQLSSDVVGGVELDKPYNNKTLLETDGVFIEIGGVPGTALVQSLGVKVDETGHVVVEEDMSTNIPGLYCAGDMVSKSGKFKQAIWAMAQGAMASSNAYQFIKKTSAPMLRGV